MIRKLQLRKTASVVIATLTLIMTTSCQKQETPPPNIIVFLVDDMGWQDTSVPFWQEETPFNKKYHTPAMERLADQGMVFTQAYACNVCSPTRVSFLTGMNAARHRVTNWTLRYNQSTDSKDDQIDFPEWNINGLSPVDSIPQTVVATTLPEVLSNKGYYTIHCGKAHFGAISTLGENPLNLGFDVNIAGHAAGAPASYQGLDNYGNDENGHPLKVWSVPGLEKYHGKDINLSDALTREALLAMDTALTNAQPFFLYMAHYAVHTPIQPDHRYYQKYKDAGLEDVEARYASLLEGMDTSLGDILNYLNQKGIADNTIILFMSDNGGLSAHTRAGQLHTHNKPLNSGKGSAYEGGIRVPMIACWPGVTQAGQRTNSPVIIDDYFPSILEMSGVTNPILKQQIDGVSFTSVLKGETTDSSRPLFWHYPNKWGASGPGIGTFSAVRQGDFKLIYWYKTRMFELYNLTDDIGEQHNLAPDQPHKVNELAGVLGRYLREVNALRPTDKNTKQVLPWPNEV